MQYKDILKIILISLSLSLGFCNGIVAQEKICLEIDQEYIMVNNCQNRFELLSINYSNNQIFVLIDNKDTLTPINDIYNIIPNKSFELYIYDSNQLLIKAIFIETIDYKPYLTFSGFDKHLSDVNPKITLLGELVIRDFSSNNFYIIKKYKISMYHEGRCLYKRRKKTPEVTKKEQNLFKSMEVKDFFVIRNLRYVKDKHRHKLSKETIFIQNYIQYFKEKSL